MNEPLTVGSLFAGIGGFDLGLERAGMRSVWQSEIDPYCQRVLAKHWPDVLRVPDVRDVGRGTVPYVDVICGGFPCQDLSYAGKGAGLEGTRSGLWSEYARAVGELRPRYVVVENVAALLGRGLGVVLSDLAALGYDAEWDCIPASAVGAHHRRDRVWLVAYPDGSGWRAVEPSVSTRQSDAEGRCEDMGDAEGHRCRQGRTGRPSPAGTGQREPFRTLQVVSHPASAGLEGWEEPKTPRRSLAELARSNRAGGGIWASEPDLPRVADGVPDWVDRTRALGNALVPQVAEWIGRRIVSYEASRLDEAA